MNTRQLGDILNRLMHEEQGSLLTRLAESTVFIPWASTEQALLVEKMIAEERQQITWVAELIDDLGESPTPATPNAWLTSLHFVEIATLMPAVINNLEQRLASCTHVGAQVAHHADASEVVGRIASRHRAHLEALRAMQNDLAISRQPSG